MVVTHSLVLALESLLAVGAYQTCSWSRFSGLVSSPRNLIHAHQVRSPVQLKHGEWGQLEDSLQSHVSVLS